MEFKTAAKFNILLSYVHELAILLRYLKLDVNSGEKFSCNICLTDRPPVSPIYELESVTDKVTERFNQFRPKVYG